MENLYNYLSAHWDDLLLVVTSVVTAASIIAKLTPNKLDDTIMSRIVGFLALSKKK